MLKDDDTPGMRRWLGSDYFTKILPPSTSDADTAMVENGFQNLEAIQLHPSLSSFNHYS